MASMKLHYHVQTCLWCFLLSCTANKPRRWVTTSATTSCDSFSLSSPISSRMRASLPQSSSSPSRRMTRVLTGTRNSNSKSLLYPQLPARKVELLWLRSSWDIGLIFIILCRYCRTVKLPWILLGAPLKVNGAPRNIQGNLTGIVLYSTSHCTEKNMPEFYVAIFLCLRGTQSMYILRYWGC